MNIQNMEQMFKGWLDATGWDTTEDWEEFFVSETDGGLTQTFKFSTFKTDYTVTFSEKSSDIILRDKDLILVDGKFSFEGWVAILHRILGNEIVLKTEVSS